jgi:NAD(P)-dependent dehydrogenase (short-subunit alcohol dehydrogenase family)/acyl carrier protein
VEIAAVTDGVFEVTGAETLRPITATILGPCQVIPQEYPRLACRSVDLELPAGGAADAAAHLLAELAGGFDDPVVAHRGRHRWLRTVDPVAVPEPPADPPLLRPDGVYLVTGGDGETGRVVAEELADAGAARLAVVVPPGHDPDPEWRRRVEERSELLLLPAELADPASMATAVAELRRRFGAGPHGVVHTAAAEDAGLVQLKSRELAAPVLAPKVAGTLALDAALGDAEPDFFALFSSSTALLGGVGQVVECAADAFVDAFARHRAGAGGHTVAIGWDSFRWHHHPQQDALPEGLRRQLEHNLEVFGIEPGECGRLLRRSLAAGLPQLWVTPRDLRAAVGEFEAMKTADLFAELGGEAGGHLRPELAVPYRAPEGEVETALAELWIDAFGIDRVGVDDDFFDLEGNSLTAVQIVTRLRSTLHVDLPLAAIFEHPTIAGLAERIEELRREARELREVDALLAEIEGLSDDEAEALLTQEGETA